MIEHPNKQTEITTLYIDVHCTGWPNNILK